MPKREDIQTILVIGSGPIVIGQACEFDYSGAQACKVLKADGYRVVLVNSNPATIMTDPGLADRTYVEPITVEFVEQVIAKERPDALLPTLGGQTGLNTAVELARAGILAKYGVEMIGCDLEAIERGEDRKQFNECMAELGIETSRSGYAYSIADAEDIVAELGYPVVLRPSFTLGGAGGGIAHDAAELHEIVGQGLELSPAGEVLVEESIEGWKEYEMEVMRDRAGNGIIVCSIENFDAMGVHTGDSITVAPAQTLTDVEYQRMRAASLAILEKIGVETGGSNVQFAVNPENGRMIVIEMNPRVSRSSALASKATGFPIAKAAAKLAVGYTLDEIVNDITKATPACFEPSIDYCVVKVPRFAFEKFQGTDDTLSTRMKAVGEVMAIGRTFEESLGKAMRSLENGRAGLGADGKGGEADASDEALEDLVARPTAERIFYLAEALRRGWTVERASAASRVDPFFVARMADIVRVQENLRGMALDELDADAFRLLKRMGLADAQIAHLTGSDELTVRTCRKMLGVRPAFKTVDTCAAEFPSATAYHYKTYDADETETAPKTRRRAMILGAGPNRIGQGIEFDYCCVHASYALHEAGFETIMVNCNPETVSTDYDTSDKLYFEPLTFEDVMDIVDVEQPDGVVVTLGGQTPLKLANALAAPGVPIMGTSPEAIDLAEDRDRFAAVLDELGIVYPAAGMASTYQEACVVADRIGFPLLVRPSYVLGGRGMGIVYDGAQLEKYMAEAAKISPDHPVYLDRFLEGAVEVDLDALCDGEQVFVGGVLEHIEMAGIHSGDSACCTPPFALSEAVQAQLRAIARRLALRLGVVGLINIQFAIKDQVIYIIEANPRASRTVPFASKGLEGDGRSAGEGRCAHHGGGEAGRFGDAARRPPARAFQREGSRHALRPLPRRRHGARPRDEVHRRGHGHRAQLPGGVREDAAGHQLRAARGRHGVRQRVRPRQARHRAHRSRHRASGLSHRGHRRHGPHVAGGRRGVRAGEEDPRGRGQRARHDRRRGHLAHDQHAVRPRHARRRLRAAPRGREARRDPRDEPRRRPGHGGRHGSRAPRRPRGRGLAGPAPVGAFALTRRVLRASSPGKHGIAPGTVFSGRKGDGFRFPMRLRFATLKAFHRFA